MWLCPSGATARRVTHDLVNSSRSFHTEADVGDPLDWDKTRDWIILRSRHYELALVVVFASAQPSTEELRQARKLRPEFSNESPATFRRRIQDGRLDLGVFPREEGPIACCAHLDFWMRPQLDSDTLDER